MSLKRIAVYFILLVPCLFAAALIWTVCVADVLYHCWDDVPIVTFIPPFVHDSVILDTGEHDFYIAAPCVVYALWIVFVAAALWLPSFVLRR